MKFTDKEFVIRDYRTTNWFWIEKQVLYMLHDHPMEFMVYCVIAEHWNDKKQNAYPSQQRIADKLRTSVRTIQRALQYLKDEEYLRVKPGTGTGRKHAEYELRDMKSRVDTGVTPQEVEGRQSSVTPGATNSSLSIYKEPSEVNHPQDTNLTVGPLASRFLTAYCTAYEKAVGKKYVIINGAKEMTTCKSLIRAFIKNLPDLVARAQAYLADKSERGFAKKSGWSLAGLSAVINAYEGVAPTSGIDAWMAKHETH